MEEELRKECVRLQTVNAALQSEMILKHAPLEALHAVRADKLAADAALARLGECVRGWAQRRGDAVPSELLQAPSNAEQVSALFEYIKSGSRRHLSAACSPKQTAVGNRSFSPAASPVVDDMHVAGLRTQLVELEVRLKTQGTEHAQELSAATAAKERDLKSLRDELAYKEQQLGEMAVLESAKEQLELAKVDAERRANEMATKHAHAAASVEKLQGQLRTKESEVAELQEAASTAAAAVASLRSALESHEGRSAELLRRLGQSEQQKSELAEQREIMQRALESSQKHAEQAQRKTESLQEQLQQREGTYRQIASRVGTSEHDRAILKSRLDAMASTLAGLESKLAEVSRRTTGVTSQQTAEDDSQTTQAVNGDSQQSEGSPAQVQLLSASSPGPLKPQPYGVKNMRKRAAPDGVSQPGKQIDRHSSQSDGTAARSPATAFQAAPQAPQCGEPEQTTASPANPVPSEPDPRESKKRRSTLDAPDIDEPKPKVAMLSGFTSKEALHELEQQLEEMGVKIKRGNAFDKTITHVVAPAGQNTWKTIAGALAQRWVVHDGWVRDSYHAFKQQQSKVHAGSTAHPDFFVDENCYGNKKETRIFNKKQFAFSGAFIAQHANKVTLMKSVAAFGGGKVLSAAKSWEAHALDARSRVTHLFVSDKEAAEKVRAGSDGIAAAAGSAGVESLTYDEFVHWIGVWRRSDDAAAKRARRDPVQSIPQMTTSKV